MKYSIVDLPLVLGGQIRAGLRIQSYPATPWNEIQYNVSSGKQGFSLPPPDKRGQNSGTHGEDGAVLLTQKKKLTDRRDASHCRLRRPITRSYEIQTRQRVEEVRVGL